MGDSRQRPVPHRSRLRLRISLDILIIYRCLKPGLRRLYASKIIHQPLSNMC